MDSNGNGKIDRYDEMFEELSVWFDTDNKGKTDPGELKTLDQLNISYINLDAFSDVYEDSNSGTRKEKTSLVYFEGGESKSISEFWFTVNTADTTYDGEKTIGTVQTFEQAIENDETGELSNLCDLFSFETNIGLKRAYLKSILYFITKSDEILPESRGGNIDARDLHVVETFMGREFSGVDGANQNSLAAETLKVFIPK